MITSFEHIGRGVVALDRSEAFYRDAAIRRQAALRKDCLLNLSYLSQHQAA